MALTLTDEYISAAELTGYVRAALEDLPENQFGLQAFLPDNLVDDIEWRAETGGGGLRRMATFRAYDAESPITGRRSELSSIRGALPPISEKRPLGEFDRLKLRKLDSKIVDAVTADAVEISKAIKTRIEVARGQLLSEGRVTLAENGLVLEADFGRAANHTQTAPILWNVDGSNPIEDELAWQQIYRNTNGVSPAVALTDQTVISTQMRNQAIRDMILPPGSTQQIVTIDALNTLRGSFGLPRFEIFEAQVEGYDGQPQHILPQGRILYLPPAGSKIGETLWGVTAEALDADYEIDSTEAPGIVVGSYSDKDPVALWTKASAISLPIAPGTNLTLSARVL